MEMNERSSFDSENNGIHGANHNLNFQGPGFLPETHKAPNSLLAMVSSVPASLWNPSAHNLGCETNANAPITRHPFPLLPGMLPAALSPFPDDSGFAERTLPFSCFNGSNLGAMINHPFRSSEPLGNFRNNAGASSGKKEMSVDEGCRDASSSLVGDEEQRDVESSHGVAPPNNEAPESSGGGGQEEGPDVACAKKRKRPGQDGEMNQVELNQQLVHEAAKKSDNVERIEPKRPASGKSNGKQKKENADGAKEEYIHVRARRGQATNSHSLAERVRREKISERMKFLQDLVPGCNKVTGKAVMLDEIINYVQSLQRQVEFLSMKLAAVNPRLDFNIEGILSKDLFHSQGAATSAFGFLPDIGHPQLHPSQFIQAGVPGVLNPADTLRRLNSAQAATNGAYKEPTHQMPTAWDGDFHNIMQIPFTPLNTQELNGKP